MSGPDTSDIDTLTRRSRKVIPAVCSSLQLPIWHVRYSRVLSGVPPHLLGVCGGCFCVGAGYARGTWFAVGGPLRRRRPPEPRVLLYAPGEPDPFRKDRAYGRPNRSETTVAAAGIARLEAAASLPRREPHGLT